MMATPPAWTAVRLQNTKRNAGGRPYASRSTWYWPPASGRSRPSSAKVKAPSRAIVPPIPQASSAAAVPPVTRATSRGLKKIPTPMIAPTTTEVASHRPSTLGRSAVLDSTLGSVLKRPMAALRGRLLAPKCPEGHISARRSTATPCPRPFSNGALGCDLDAPIVHEAVEVGGNEAVLGLLEVGDVEAEAPHSAAQQLLLPLGRAPEVIDQDAQGSHFLGRERIPMLRHCSLLLVNVLR